jgi:hypothetical protein
MTIFEEYEENLTRITNEELNNCMFREGLFMRVQVCIDTCKSTMKYVVFKNYVDKHC